MSHMIHPYNIYPIDEAPPGNAEVFYRELTKNMTEKYQPFTAVIGSSRAIFSCMM